mmetsp:Transcript_46738/g.82403  ORF Transcript_46738/g.82403 Transcript_46738/m.82403 type:complete len:192 (+) Transcript_46738:3-578(+)
MQQGMQQGMSPTGMHQSVVFYSMQSPAGHGPQMQAQMQMQTPQVQQFQTGPVGSPMGSPMMQAQQMPGDACQQQVMMQQGTTCTFWGPAPTGMHTGLPDMAAQCGSPMMGCGGPMMGMSFMPRPAMTIEELPAEAYQAIAIEGKLAMPAIADGPPRLPESMPTCNGFIHFKDTDASDPDATPTGRPRAASH